MGPDFDLELGHDMNPIPVGRWIGANHAMLGSCLAGALLIAAADHAYAWVDGVSHRTGLLRDTLSYTTGATNRREVSLSFIKGTAREPSPTVILAHGCDGAYGKSIGDWAGRIRWFGYNWVLPDSFTSRLGTDNICSQAYAVTAEERADDLEAMAQWISRQPWHRGGIGILGFSLGAGAALEVAYRGSDLIKVTVAYYPMGSFFARKPNPPLLPVQIHIGEADDWTPPGGVRELIARPGHEQMRAAARFYPGAHHAFDSQWAGSVVATIGGPRTVRYHPSAAARSIEATRQFLAEALKGEVANGRDQAPAEISIDQAVRLLEFLIEGKELISILRFRPELAPEAAPVDRLRVFIAQAEYLLRRQHPGIFSDRIGLEEKAIAVQERIERGIDPASFAERISIVQAGLANAKPRTHTETVRQETVPRRASPD